MMYAVCSCCLMCLCDLCVVSRVLRSGVFCSRCCVDVVCSVCACCVTLTCLCVVRVM